MPTEIIHLLAFEGPNRYGPQPGVWLLARSDKDRSPRMRAALKDGAQSIGIVLGMLDVAAEPVADGAYAISAQFATPTPALGLELVRYVVEGLNAREARDETWDPDEGLWQLQRRRRAEALPVTALQLMAEASARGVPAFVRADGALQLGYGARGQTVALPSREQPNLLGEGAVGVGGPFARADAPPQVPWERLGPIPVVALSGGAERVTAAGLVAEGLRARGHTVVLDAAAGFEAARALLADPTAQAAVIGLEPGELVRRGLAFQPCPASALLSLPDALPEFSGPRELAEALGVPLLVTAPAGVAVLNADEPAIVALADYPPCSVVLISRRDDNPAVARHRANGGAALFLREGAIVAARGADERPAGGVPSDEPLAALAAAALLSGLRTED